MSNLDECLRGAPKTIKLGAYDWNLIIEDGDDGLCGQAVFQTSTIRLWPKNLTSTSHAVGVLLHEYRHVIFENAGLSQLKRGKDEREEQIIEGFEIGLVSLFRDNPKLMTWVRKWIK